MNEEAAFQAHLDLHPDDHTCRLVFADWLEERGDPRAPGYRALGINKRYLTWRDDPCWIDGKCGDTPMALPSDWFCKLRAKDRTRGSPYWPAKRLNLKRREVEDATALAFFRLPASRRAELLNPAEVPA